MPTRPAEPRTPAAPPLELVAPSASPAADPPTEVEFRLDGEQRARYEALLETLRQQGRGGSRAALLLAALEALAHETERPKPTGRPPAQIIVQRCPECAATHAETARGPKRLSPTVAEALACDAEVVDAATGHARRTIAPAVRRQVLARDGHRCRAPGCGATRFLEIHHVRPRRAGGNHRPENLITLCARCHRHLHETAAACAGASVQDIVMEWIRDSSLEPREPTMRAEAASTPP